MEARKTSGWIEPEGGDLVRFADTSWEGAISAWIELDGLEETLQWRRGAIGARVSDARVYGSGSLAVFASSVGASYSRLRSLVATHRRIERLDPESRAEVLSMEGLTHTHYELATPLKNDREYVKALKKAHDLGWRSGPLGEEVKIVKEAMNGRPEEPETAEDEPTRGRHLSVVPEPGEDDPGALEANIARAPGPDPDEPAPEEDPATGGGPPEDDGPTRYLDALALDVIAGELRAWRGRPVKEHERDGAIRALESIQREASAILEAL